MNRFALALLSSTALAALSSPCLAEEETTAKKVLMTPVRAAGVFVGMAVGTPIAIGRCARKRFNDYVADAHDEDGSAGLVLAVPMGLGEGFAQGLFYGPRNAIVHYNEPFSKESLSLAGDPAGK